MNIPWKALGLMFEPLPGGAIGLIFFAAFLAIGVPWMLAIR